jgi:hypothetical protein
MKKKVIKLLQNQEASEEVDLETMEELHIAM